MLEKIGRLAEHVASGASRRAFLGRLGRGALSLAAITAGLLALPREAQAATRARCCYYRCGSRGGTRGHYVCHSDGSACRPGFTDPRLGSCVLRNQSLVRNCDRCG
jgi:hypothetical protein